MNSSDKINKSIKESRYIFLALFLSPLGYFYSFGEFNLFMFLVVGCVFLIILLSNNFISAENKGEIAILHMVMIV